MDTSTTFKSVLWRVIVWKWVPLYIGFLIGMLMVSWEKGYPDFPFLGSAIASLLVTVIFSFVFRRSYDIVVHDGKISGPSTGLLSKQSFSIVDLDFSYLHKQSFYEKISFYKTIRSLSGQKIMVTDFIYGEPVANELCKILEQEHLQSEES